MQEFGRINPHAPAELSRFAFLIGSWRCEARLKSDDGRWRPTLPATWIGRFVLDGYVIADEYRMMDTAGKPVVLGINLRSYEAANRAWHIKWLNAFAGTWVDLGPPELGGVVFENRSVTYAFEEPVAAHAYTRATYTDISEEHFTWRGERSADFRSWQEFMVVECYRRHE